VAVASPDEEGRVQPRQIHSIVTTSSMSEYALNHAATIFGGGGGQRLSNTTLPSSASTAKSMHDSSSHFAIRHVIQIQFFSLAICRHSRRIGLFRHNLQKG
jgi:hypothetical protein